jgi:hypothetical protein
MQSVPPPPMESAAEFRRANKQPAKVSYFAPVAPVKPAQSPEPAPPDYAAMRRAEVACLTEKGAMSRTQRRSKALFDMIAANPARMKDSRLRYLTIMMPAPPTINEKAELPEGAIYAR